VKHGRADHRADVLSLVARIAGTLRERQQPVIVTLSNYQRLAGTDAVNGAPTTSGRVE